MVPELEQIRNQDYEVNSQETLRGVHHVGAPILDENNNPIAGIEIVGAAHRMTEDGCHNELSDAVRATATEIELNLQHSD